MSKIVLLFLEDSNASKYENISLTPKLLDKLVPLPSIFFIGTNGQPIDIVTGVIASSSELNERIKIVAERAQINLPNSIATSSEPNTAGPSTVSASATSSPAEEVVCDNGVCQKIAKETKASETPADTKALDEKLKIAKELLEKKKKDKENEDAKVVYSYYVIIELFFNLLLFYF